MDKIEIETKGHNDIIDLTSKIKNRAKKAVIRNGLVLIFSLSSTVGLTIIEYELELLKDFKEFLEKIIPANQDYHHDHVWSEKNGFAHLRSALFRPFLVLPLEKNELVLGPWQNIILIDFDNHPRKREIFIKIIKE